MDSDKQKEVCSWITQCFAERNYETINVKFPDYDTRGGSLGDILFVDVTARDKNAEETFNLLIKLSKSDSIVLDDMNLRVAYKNEINFYSKIVPFFKKFAEDRKSRPFDNLPQCFGTIIKEQLYVILMENLRPKGYNMHGLERPQDITCARLVLEAYAEWQALCLAVKDQEPEMYRKFAENNEDFQKKKLIKLSHASIKKELGFVIGLYKEKGDIEMVEKITNFREHFDDNYFESMSVENCNYPVIRHGDCWNNNFLFVYNERSMPTEVRILDWQTATLGSPLIDIAELLFFCCSRKEIEHMDSLLQLYHSTLSEKMRQLGSNPEKCFPWEACLKSFKRYAPLAIAGVPFITKMCFSSKFLQESSDQAETAHDGDFSALLGEDISDPEAFFKRLNSILELCVERDLI